MSCIYPWPSLTSSSIYHMMDNWLFFLLSFPFACLQPCSGLCFSITLLFSFRTAAALKRKNDSQTNGSYCCELFLNRCSRSGVCGPKSSSKLLRQISPSLHNEKNFSHCSSTSFQLFLSFISCFVYLTCMFHLYCVNSAVPQWETLQQFASVLSARIFSRVPRSKGRSDFSPPLICSTVCVCYWRSVWDVEGWYKP